MVSGSTWLYADPHFGHKNIVKFTRSNGEKLRPWDDINHMNEDMIRAYNDKVSDIDRVYILGDFGSWRFAERLKGRKVLVKGNHDVDKLSQYSQFFDDIRAYVVKKGFILSHIPIHPGSMGRWKLNIHGHLHSDVVYHVPHKPSHEIVDDRYKCVSVEHTGFAPILLDTVLKERGLV